MPVGRILLKSISQSKKLSRLNTHGARLLFSWLIPSLDKNGCFSGEASVIKGLIFTRLNDSDEEIEEYLRDLEDTELIVRYEVNGDLFLNVPDFEDRQPNLNKDREGKTNIPLPSPDLIKSKSGLNPLKDKIKEVKLREGKDEYPPEFESFWEEYPNHKQVQDAYDAWKELNKTEKAEVEIAAVNYSIECINNKEELKYIKHASSFCRKKKKRWKDYLTPIEPIKKVGESTLPEKTGTEKIKDTEYMKARMKKRDELFKKYSSMEFHEREDKVRDELAKWHEGWHKK